MRRFTILGSGFGLYGYLPALLGLGHKVALPERYRPVVDARQELSQFTPCVDWCADAEAALAGSDAVVVALRPADQARWIPRLVRAPDLRQLILEKPVAPAPELAASLLAELEGADKRYRVAYTFRLLSWAPRLRPVVREEHASLSLDWTFLAHHYRHDRAAWKRFDAEGGGALRFYGIHVVALLAELGYDDVASSLVWRPSDAETQRWKATFTGPNLCPFAVDVDSRTDATSFRIASCGDRAQTLVDQPDPFSGDGAASPPGQDIRVGVLERLCRSLEETDDDHARRQRAILSLWARVEEKSNIAGDAHRR
jgi:predicted dehydrogenase